MRCPTSQILLTKRQREALHAAERRETILKREYQGVLKLIRDMKLLEGGKLEPDLMELLSRPREKRFVKLDEKGEIQR